MEILNNIPSEIKNKILLYLSHPCADMIKEECENNGCEEFDTKLDFSTLYFKEYNICCKRCKALLRNKSQYISCNQYCGTFILCENCFFSDDSDDDWMDNDDD
jgi:hypothetical protein